MKKSSASNDNENMDNDTDLDKEMFIDIVRQYPIIWMPRHPAYKDTAKKRVKWQYIHKHHLQKQFSGK